MVANKQINRNKQKSNKQKKPHNKKILSEEHPSIPLNLGAPYLFLKKVEVCTGCLAPGPRSLSFLPRQHFTDTFMKYQFITGTAFLLSIFIEIRICSCASASSSQEFKVAGSSPGHSWVKARESWGSSILLWQSYEESIVELHHFGNDQRRDTYCSWLFKVILLLGSTQEHNFSDC